MHDHEHDNGHNHGHAPEYELSRLQQGIGTLLGPQLSRLQTLAIGAAVLGLVLSIGGFLMHAGDPRQFFASYLFAYLFWLGVTTGSLALLCLHHTVGGGWGYILRRPLEAATKQLPLMAALFFIPMLLGGLAFLYGGPGGWANAATVASDPQIQVKTAYLNPTRWYAFAVLYFVLWGIWAWRLNALGRTQDERNDLRVSSALNKWGASGILMYVLTTTFMSVDWVMSLMPRWNSSIFGLLTVAGQALSTLALMLVLLWFVAGELPLLRNLPTKYVRDVSNLMLASTLLWGYMSFSQYLITVSGNTVEEISWYIIRARNVWGVVSLSLVFFHFFAPFLFLVIGGNMKQDVRRVGKLAIFIIIMRFIDLFWWVTPPFREQLWVSLADFGMPLLLGGIWVWSWAAQLKAADRPVAPAHDPRLAGNWQEVVEHG